MRNLRINVTLNPSDLEVMQILCAKKKMSMSSLVKKMIKEWLEGYENLLLAKRTEEAEKRWEEANRPTISHEELWKRLDTWLNTIQESKKS
ncbi:MAG: DUF6290 family protein [Parachlamydiaceae bacterium]